MMANPIDPCPNLGMGSILSMGDYASIKRYVQVWTHLLGCAFTHGLSLNFHMVWKLNNATATSENAYIKISSNLRTSLYRYAQI